MGLGSGFCGFFGILPGDLQLLLVILHVFKKSFKIFCLRVFGRLCASLRISAPFAIHRFTAIRGKLRVSEVCSNKLKFSNL